MNVAATPWPWGWMVHGAALVLMALALPVMEAQSRMPEWAELMTLLGQGPLVEPLRAVLPQVVALAPGLVVTGLACLAAGALGRWRNWRWPLQAVAAVHLVLVPWSAWWSHGLLPLGNGPLTLLGEILSAVAGMALVVWSLVAVGRCTSKP